MNIRINKYNPAMDNNLPLYREECGQESRAYLYVDTDGDGEMWVDYKNASDNSCSPREWHGIVRRFRIPNNLTELGYNQLLGYKLVLELAQLIIDGSEVYWDGNNYCARMDENAQEAHDALERFCDCIEPNDFSSLDPVCADYYLVDGTYEALMSSGGTEEDVAERIVAEAIKDGYFLGARDVKKTLLAMKDRE